MKVPVATAWQLPAVNGVRFSGPPPGPPPVDPEPPPVEGWEHGSTVTLTPAMFGLATFGDDPNMRLFDTVDNQSSYDALADDAIIPVGTSYPWRKNTTWGNKVTIDRSVGPRRHPYDAARYRIFRKSYLGNPTNMYYLEARPREIFFEWWQRMETAVTGTGSNKLVRIWGTASRERYLSWTNQQALPFLDNSLWTSTARPLTSWDKLGVWLDCKSTIPSEWVGTLYKNGQVMEQVTGNWPNTRTDPITDAWSPPTIYLFGWDYSVEAGALDGHFGDAYLSVTPKRFMLNSAATLAGTVGENQEIVSWSPSSVQLRMFYGATTPTHLHFINDHNAPTGSPIEIGVV